MITIKACKTADTRTMTEAIAKDVLLKSSEQHIEDVTKAIHWMTGMLEWAALHHDYTKLSDIVQFHKDCVDCQADSDKQFKKMEWYQHHVTEERHHLQEYVHDNVNLFDVLEYIADNVMAGLARTGMVRDCTLEDSVLRTAFNNTINQLVDRIEVTK